MKLGIVGSGLIVHMFLPIAKQIPGLQLAAITTTKRSKQVGKDLAEKYGIVTTFTDYDEMLKSPDVDTIYICVPNFLHYEYSKKAIIAGKNVICEKPFVTKLAQLQELRLLAEKQNVIFVEAIKNIYLPNFNAIKENLARIGKIHIINFNYTQYSSRYDAFLAGKIAPAFDPKKNGGALMDIGIYNIHLLTALFGKAHAVQYYPNIQRNIDTSGVLMASYHDGKQASLIVAKDSSALARSFIEGENGSIYIDGHINELPNFTVAIKGKDEEHFNFNEHDDMVDEFLAFEDMVDTHNMEASKQSLQESEDVCSILEKARSSYM